MPTRPGSSRFVAPVTSRQVVVYTAGALVYAALNVAFAAVPLSLPLGNGITFQVAPGLVVPLFMGLVAGPVAGLWVGLAGRLLGDALAGAGFNAVGLLYSGVLGAVAGLGFRRAGAFRTLPGLLRAELWVLLAAAAAALVGGLANYLTISPHDMAAAIDQGLSSLVTAGLTGGLLLPMVLVIRGDRRADPKGASRDP
ncbi:MAG: ECF transporter S component [Anaerolineales bacterium]